MAQAMKAMKRSTTAAPVMKERKTTKGMKAMATMKAAPAMKHKATKDMKVMKATMKAAASAKTAGGVPNDKPTFYQGQKGEIWVRDWRVMVVKQ
jgi:hypothetical protein